MNWNFRQTVEWESEQMKRFAQREVYRVFESIGRMFLTFFLFINTTMGLASLPEQALSELGTAMMVDLGVIEASFLKLAFVIVAIWAVMPGVRAVYRLWVYRKSPPSEL